MLELKSLTDFSYTSLELKVEHVKFDLTTSVIINYMLLNNLSGMNLSTI